MRKYEGIKKVDLNCHLDGSLSIDLASKWLKISKDEAKEVLGRTDDVKGLNDYLEKFKLPIDLLQNKTHLKEASACLGDALVKESVIYAEVIIAPLSHTKKGLTTDEVIESVLEGFTSSKANVRLVLAMRREDSLSENKKIITLAKRFIKKGVVGVTLLGDEELFPTATFKGLFEYADEKGIPFTICAGENGSFKEILSAINLGASRITCGTQAIKDYKTMETLKKKNIPLEICLSNTLDMKLYSKITEHPIQRLIDSGVSVILASGNRTISKTDLAHEYYLLNKYFNTSLEDFKKMNRYAIEQSLLPEDEKKKLLEEL